MAIKLEEIDQTQFRVSSRIHDILGEVIIVVPGYGKHKWKDEELHLRSLMCAPDGTILSPACVCLWNLFPSAVGSIRNPRADLYRLRILLILF